MSTNRRQFLARTSALTGAAMAGAFGRFGIESASAQAADYKALVCLFQFGGADSNNMIVPDSDYAQYALVRTAGSQVGIPQANLLTFTASRQGGKSFGFHPSLQPLKDLYDQKKLAIVANAGIMALPKRETKHGYELQFFTNHVGHFGSLTGENDAAFAALDEAIEKNPKLRVELNRVKEIDDLGAERASAKRLGHGRRRITCKVHRREQREERQREEAGRDRKQRSPAGEEAARDAHHAPGGVDRDGSRSDGGEHEAERHRCQCARGPEDATVACTLRGAPEPVRPEHERRPAKDDADEREGDRHVARNRDRGEGARIGGEEHDDHEDQPDVVGFPDGRDGVLDRRALVARAGASRDEVPEATPEVRASGEHVEHEPGPEDPPRDVMHGQAALPRPSKTVAHRPRTRAREAWRSR